jgi:hypothetical protein
MKSRQKFVLVALAVLATAFAAAAVWMTLDRPGMAVPSAVAAVRQRPAARPSDYVGSQSCAACHAEIFDRYQTHSMSHSMATIGDDPPIEQLEEEILLRPAGPQHAGHEYLVQWDGAAMHHGDRMRDVDGEVIFEQVMPVRFAIGSGRRGRAYVIEKEGRLAQSPIGWYAHGERWDLSPGYDEDPSLRFERAIGDGCLYCHAGRVDVDPQDPSRYEEPIFLEASIGCERCHGPGGRHVVAMEQLAEGQSCDNCEIVNPADLDPAKREAVCNQCHLAGESAIPRFGRGLFDFRPGDHLDDTLVVFVQNARADSGRAVSQVEQMQSSRCYQASGAVMGCTTCHDPHWQPPPAEAAAFFDQRCATCHELDDCGLEEPQRLAHESGGSCVACHMPSEDSSDVPHTALTDHSIPRDAAASKRVASGRRQGQPVVFDNGESRLDPQELSRAQGMLLATIAVDARSPQLAAQAATLLTPADINPNDPGATVAPLAGDVEALLSLGELFDGVGQDALTAACYAQALAADPCNQPALMSLARLEQQRGSFNTALAFADRLANVNDTVAEVHMLRAGILAGLGRWEEGIAAADEAIALDPTRLDIRSWLVQSLKVAGQPERAEGEQAILDRMRAVQGALGASPSR